MRVERGIGLRPGLASGEDTDLCRSQATDLLLDEGTDKVRSFALVLCPDKAFDKARVRVISLPLMIPPEKRLRRALSRPLGGHGRGRRGNGG